MRTEFLQVPEAYYNHVFKWMWRAAFVLALAFGGSAAIWPQYSIPLLAVPFIGALIAGAVIGWKGGAGPAASAQVDAGVRFPPMKEEGCCFNRRRMDPAPITAKNAAIPTETPTTE